MGRDDQMGGDDQTGEDDLTVGEWVTGVISMFLISHHKKPAEFGAYHQHLHSVIVSY